MKDDGKTLFVAAIIFVAVCGVFWAIYQAVPTSLGSGSASDSGKDARHAYIAAREICKRALKAPSTAKFSTGAIGSTDDLDSVAEQSGDSWHASGVVDSQNSFGAMIRSPWSAWVKRVPSGWQVVELSLDGERIFSRLQSDLGNRVESIKAIPETESEKAARLKREFEQAQEQEKIQAAKDLEAAKEQAAQMEYEARSRNALTNRIIAHQMREASNGLPSFQLILGKRYLTGDGVETNLALAKHWLQSACTNGEPIATNLLSQLK